MSERRSLLAVALILIGIIVLLGNFAPVFQLRIIWPVILIIIGLGIMFKELC